jgi:hypothetical protein
MRQRPRFKVQKQRSVFVGPLAWIIHDFAGEKRKDALKEVMNTGFWRT